MSPIVLFLLIFENMHSFKIQPTSKPEINELLPAQTIIEIFKGELRPVFSGRMHANRTPSFLTARTHTYVIARVCTHVRNSFFEKIFLSLSQSILRPLFWCSLKSGLNWPKMEMSRMIMQARIFFMPKSGFFPRSLDFSREIWILYIGARSCSASLDTISPVSNPSNIKTMLK